MYLFTLLFLYIDGDVLLVYTCLVEVVAHCINQSLGEMRIHLHRFSWKHLRLCFGLFRRLKAEALGASRDPKDEGGDDVSKIPSALLDLT